MADSNLDIWRLQAQADTQGLIAALQHSDPEIRRRAATALRALGATSAIPALQASLVDERDTDIRRTILSVLDYLFEQEMDEDGEESADEAGQSHQVVYWIAQLTSDKADQIIRAAQYLAEAKEKIAVETLILVFRNSDLPSHARLAAAEALIKLESAPVEVTLLAALRHPDWRTRRNAAAVLAQISAEWAVEPLAAALHDDHEMVRKTAYAALKHLATPEALEALEAPPIANAPVAPPPSLEPQLLADLSTPAEAASPAKEVVAATPAAEPKSPATPPEPQPAVPPTGEIKPESTVTIAPAEPPTPAEPIPSSAPLVPQEPSVASVAEAKPAAPAESPVIPAASTTPVSEPVAPPQPVEPPAITPSVEPGVPPEPAVASSAATTVSQPDVPATPPEPQAALTPSTEAKPAAAPVEPPVITAPAAVTQVHAVVPVTTAPSQSPSPTQQDKPPHLPEMSHSAMPQPEAAASTSPQPVPVSSQPVMVGVSEPIASASPAIPEPAANEEDTHPLSPALEDDTD